MKKAFVYILTALLALSMLAFLLPAFTANQVVQQTAPTNTNQQPGIITNVTSQPAVTPGLKSQY